MEERHRTEIIIETDRMYVLRKRRNPSHALCVECERPSKMVPPDEVLDVSGLRSRAIYRAVETGKVHFIETPEGSVLICLNSLSLLTNRAFPSNVPSGSFGQSITSESTLTLSNADSPVLPTSAITEAIRNKIGAEGRTKAWVLTEAAFDQLLSCLGADHESAGRKYENIRCKLLSYFESRGCLSPEDLTDETINRVARRVSQGREIWTTDPANYFFGVARNVLREYWGAPERQTVPLEHLSLPTQAYEHPGSFIGAEAWTVELRLEALEKALSELPTECSELIIEYYHGERGDKIRNRQNIAKRLGIPANALRIRVHRIREKLEARVLECLKQAEK